MEKIVEFTPRFHKIGSSKNNLIIVEQKKKKIQTCKNLSKFKQRSDSNIKNRKSALSIETTKNYDLDSFIKTFNIKKKFIIKNDFDRKNSKKFLQEKYLMLEKPVLLDEICN